MTGIATEAVAVQPTVLQLTAVMKSFGDNRVLHGVDLEVRRGEVHALIGGNGAGKSTLMKILQGVYKLDGGTIEIDGQPSRFQSSNDARANGVGMVFQEFSLVPTLNVAQNIFLSHEPLGRGGFLDDKESHRRSRKTFEQMGVEIDPGALVANLSSGSKQLTEIAKALSQDARILIMDEPNSALTKAETQALFVIIRRLKKQGIAIIYITHRLEEVYEIADRITVLRDGRRVITKPVADLSLPELIEHMVGSKVEHSLLWHPREVKRSGTPLLEVRNLKAGARVRGVSFELFSGEILGLAGLVGSGRSETAHALFGVDRIDSGDVLVKGERVDIRNPGEAIRAGLGLVPEDRRTQGLVLEHTVRDNLLLPVLTLLQRWGLLQDRKGDALVNSYVDELKIKTDSIRKLVGLLSGGNQQKVVIAKWLSTMPNILILDEPTVGVDIATKIEIVNMIRALADNGKAIIYISSELPELLAVSDRILVLRNGTVYRTLDRAELDSHIAEGDQVRIGVAEDVLNRIVQGESQIKSTGPHGEPATPPSQVRLSDDEIDRIKAMNGTAAILMHYSSDWSQAQQAGLRAEFAKMSVEVIAVTDAGFSAEKQAADIESVLALRPNVIVAFPVDPNTTAAAFAKAAAAGIKIVFMDNVPAGMQPGRDYVSLVSGDNAGCGEASAYIMADGLSGKGTVGIVFHAADFFVTRQRYESFKETITKHYPGIEIAAEEGVAGPDFRADAAKAAAAMLVAHPRLNGVWAAWDDLAEGVVDAAHAAHRHDLVVTTVDYGERIGALLAKGDLVIGLSAQRPYDQGATEATLAGYGLLDKPAPPYVAWPSLNVTKDNVIGAWRAVYRRDPPPSVAARA